ncbi:MAG TPA: cysteine--tRNA ligase [Bacillota bacterium]|nr:cysteine--tRNA ligase [Bacillota bacterium]
MSIKIYNTLTKTKEEFIPRDPGKVSIYVCGPTPYDFAHIGNARPPVFWDTVRRFLNYRGYQLLYIQNITDVEDKIIGRANRLNRNPLELAAEFAGIYLEDLKTLGVLPAERYPKVSEHIPEIIEMVRVLMEKGHAYPLAGDVYFAVDSFPDYGKLSGRALEELQAGARVEVNQAKQNPMDFALWKAAKPGEISWDSPWGKGRPGWHIECSAMSLKYLGQGFDMHGGGEDLVFPHHENEIAQSESYAGAPFVQYWLHNAFITVKGEKMAKSEGNFSTIRDVINRYPPQAVRLWFAGSHYRSPISFGEAELKAAVSGLERLENARFNWEHLLKQTTVNEAPPAQLLSSLADIIHQTETGFIEAMEDDFNTPQALAHLYDLVRETNRISQNPDFHLNQAAKNLLTEALNLLLTLGGILGILTGAAEKASSINPAEVEEQIARRTQAKKDRNFALADQIRDELKNKGIILEDTPQGIRWRSE